MREMVLNHASILGSDRYSMLRWLRGVAEGMSTLRVQSVVTNELKSCLEFHEVKCAEDLTLHDAIFDLRSVGAREEYLYLSRLTLKAPLREIIAEPHRDRFLRCEIEGFDAIGLSPRDAEPLLYCAITDGIAVGFPSDPLWDRDTVDVLFNEISPDGDEIGDATDTIDNLTRSEHATTILERHRTHLRHSIANFEELWEQRESAFPNLVFGPDVEDQLQEVNPGDLSAIVKKLSIIDQSAARWQVTDSAMPEWNGNVTPESNSVRNNPALISARRFRSNSGSTKIFEWHTRFGNAGRIHLRFDASTKLVEIGYIGKHLPLPP